VSSGSWKRPLRPAVLLVVATALAVVLYNTWSLCCGRCTVGTFARLGVPGWSLAGMSLAAGLVWLVLRWRTCSSARPDKCPDCSRLLRTGWRFCPDCRSALER